MLLAGGYQPGSVSSLDGTLEWPDPKSPDSGAPTHVSDIGAVVEQLRAAGVAIERFVGLDQDERGVWRSPSGAFVAWFKDPDGNTLSLTQSC